MPAKLIAIGEPAHASERQALRFLVNGLDDRFTVYGNPWLVEKSGVVYELDAVVVAPHAVFVVEIKSNRGRIEGTDNDWYVPHPVRSPIKKNRLTAQILKSHLQRASYDAGKAWVEGLVFLSATTDVGVKGPASRDRLHTRKTLLAALKDEELVRRLSRRHSLAPTTAADAELLRIFQKVREGPQPLRRIREYEIEETLEHQQSSTELLGRHVISGERKRLRLYTTAPLASEEERQRTLERARWTIQVLGRLGRIDGVLRADAPFSDEAGIVLPLESFEGITLTTWIDRYGPKAPKQTARADLKTRTDLWIRIAETLDEVHRQGVVHRLLRGDVVLVEDRVDPHEIRVTGFDLAKQIAADTTVSLTSVSDERLVFAAPEVVTAFSSAEPASDQFSLGALLAWILTGQPLFESTRQLMATRRLMQRVRDMAQRIPLSLDEAVNRMVAQRPTERFPTLEDAIDAVRRGRDPESRTPALFPELKTSLDPDNLEPGNRVGADYEILTRLGLYVVTCLVGVDYGTRRPPQETLHKLSGAG